MADHLANFAKPIFGLGTIENATCMEQAVLLSEENANAARDTPAREFDICWLRLAGALAHSRPAISLASGRGYLDQLTLGKVLKKRRSISW